MSSGGTLPQDDWETILRNVPIVSVDLVVRQGDGIILGKRANEPARGEWFIPGGRVHKHEQLETAVHRIARDELGTDVEIDRQLGVYEHFYQTAEVSGVDGKHYVPIAYVVSTTGEDVSPDSQHSQLSQFTPPFEDVDLHPYVRTYLADAGVLSSSE